MKSFIQIHKKLIYITAFLGILSSSGCHRENKNSWKSSDKVKIVATTTMVTDLVRQVGGDKVEVIGLMDEGVNPHDYEATASATALIKSADLIIYSGLHLEHKLAGELEKMSNSVAVTSAMSNEVLIFPKEELEKYADPHVWGDVQLWQKTVQPVVAALSKIDASNADYYKKRGTEYMKELEELHLWCKQRLEEVSPENRVLITSHDAFMYFARAYDIEVKAIDGLSPDDKASSKKVQHLIEFIKSRGIKMIFPEHAVNDKSVRSIAQDAGVAVSEKELFSDATGPSGEMETWNGEVYDLGTYIGMQKHNVNAVVEGLKQ